MTRPTDPRIVRRLDNEWLADVEARAADIIERDRLACVERDDRGEVPPC